MVKIAEPEWPRWMIVWVHHHSMTHHSRYGRLFRRPKYSAWRASHRAASNDSEDALAEKADVLDVKAAISEARHDDDETQAPEEVEDHTSTAHHRPIPLEAILSAGAGWSRFGMVWIGNPHKFHLSALYYDPEDLFDGVPMYVTCFQNLFFCNEGFFEVSYLFLSK